MMKVSPAKTGLRGEITVPGDKSISHRSIMLGAIADGRTEISGFLSSDDCLSTIACFRQMGIEIETKADNKVLVHGKGLYGLSAPKGTLYTGNSGTTTRLMMGILSAQPFGAEIDGDSSIRKRPMRRVAEPLRQMGAQIESDNCPLQIKGKELSGIDYTLPVASAQLKSALILAGIYASGETIITEPIKTRNHTEIMLKNIGADIKEENGAIHIKKVDRLSGFEISVPGDISSAAFFMVAALIIPNSKLTIKNVGINPTRTGIIDVLRQVGGDIVIENERLACGEAVGDITVTHSQLSGVNIGGAIIPRLIDEIPIIAVAAAMAKGRTTICDAAELKVKESNRILAVVTELKKAGVDICETEDGMIINGGNQIAGAEFEGFDDHRIIMSEYILGLVGIGESNIIDESAVSISFPGFFELINSCFKEK